LLWTRLRVSLAFRKFSKRSTRLAGRFSNINGDSESAGKTNVTSPAKAKCDRYDFAKRNGVLLKLLGSVLGLLLLILV